MLTARLVDGCLDRHPIPDRADFAEGHSGLNHAERSGIHSKKDHSLAAVGKLPQISLVAAPRIAERIIDVCDRSLESDAIDGSAKSARGLNHLVCNRVKGFDHFTESSAGRPSFS